MNRSFDALLEWKHGSEILQACPYDITTWLRTKAKRMKEVITKAYFPSLYRNIHKNVEAKGNNRHV